MWQVVVRNMAPNIYPFRQDINFSFYKAQLFGQRPSGTDLNRLDCVLQRANAADIDANHLPYRQREIVAGNDARARG